MHTSANLKQEVFGSTPMEVGVTSWQLSVGSNHPSHPLCSAA